MRWKLRSLLQAAIKNLVQTDFINKRCDGLVDGAPTSCAAGVWFEYGQGRCNQSLNNTGLQKIFPRINFQYSLRFSPAEYEYINHFFPARPDFPKNFVKGLKITLNGCFYLILMLKITIKFNAMHAQNSSKGVILKPIYNF